ncbi:MAG TPA: hypothetical protein DCL44_00740 [Elusimicrobia bacterium]|nr:hypothetical protein [Elusimicrobiota bacterium]
MTNLKLRLKHPSGAEFEAEGPAEFILTEKTSFLKTLATEETAAPKNAAEISRTALEQNTEFWDKIVVKKHDLNILKIKPPEMTAREAALVLLAAQKIKESKQSDSAITLSRAIKASGYSPGRIDRLLASDIKTGRVTASGTKRNRSYAIKDSGLEAAWLAARKIPK